MSEPPVRTDVTQEDRRGSPPLIKAMKSNRRLRLITGLLSAILLISIASNYFLFSRGKQYYLRLNETRLHPLGLHYYSTNPNQRDHTDPERTTVVFFGDSRAAGWLSPNDFNQFEFINRGIGAQTSAQAIHRFDYHIRPLQPQIIVVQVGINDLKTIPLFPDRKEFIIDDCQENIRQIVGRATDLDTIVILTTIFPLGKVPIERRLFWSEDVALAVDETNAYIRSLERENVIVLDAFSILADEEGITRAEYSRDLLHINTSGYEALNDELTQVLTAFD